MTYEYTIYSTLEECLAGADIIVEATNFEKHQLWKDILTHNCQLVNMPDAISWKQHTGGWLPTVGYVYKKAVCISTMFATINNKFVLFWHPTSRMVDHAKIDEYFKKHCREDVKHVECYSFSPQLFN